MASSARIDELQKKFAENPRRYFAPLADEYRKAGDTATAIEICRAHLAQQPGHMSGHIVLGKALHEAGTLDEAQQTFETALALDPENLIALRHLGDIAHQQGDPRTARSWYQRVLDADPRNEEIAAQLRTLDDEAAASGAAGAAGAAGGARDAADRGGEVEPIDLSLDLPADLAKAPDTLAQDTVADGALPTAMEPSAIAYLAEEETSAAADLDAPASPAALGADLMFGDEPAGAEPARASSELTFLDTSDDAADAVPVVGGDIGLESMEFVPPSGADRSVAGTDGLLERAYDFEPPAEPAAEPPADAFATETMAELYLQQGHHDRALEVYQQLLAKSPDDEALRARVARLQHDVAPDAAATAGIDESAYASEASDAGERPSTSGGGRSAREFFGALASRRARGGAAAAAAGTSAVQPAPGEAVGRSDADVGTPAQDLGAFAMDESYATPTAADTFADMAPAHDYGGTSGTDSIDALEVADDAAGGNPYDVAAYEEATFEAGDAGAPFEGSMDRSLTPPAVSSLGREDAFALTDDMGGAPTFADAPDTLAEDTTPDGALPAALEPSALAYLADESGDPMGDAIAPPAVARHHVEERPTMGRAATPADGVSGTLDALFAGAGTAADDEAAANTLAGLFGGADAPAASERAPVPPASPTNSPAVRPARNELSLDHVFRETPRQSGAQRREASAFSFDQFFSDAPEAPAAPAAPEQPPEAGGDIEQFTAWLEGLKKK